MKKIFLFIAALTLSVGLWAIDNVKYLDANGQEQTANNVTEITNSSDTLDAGWYVVTGTNVQTGGLVCNGAVHIILADGAKLTATGAFVQGGIEIPSNGSLTIYGQSTGGQMGQLIVTGGAYSPGIGGAAGATNFSITFNGGEVIATGGTMASGIGSMNVYDFTVTINGGEVTGIGGESGIEFVPNADGIGAGMNPGFGWNFYVSTSLQVQTNGTVIDNDGGNLAAKISGKDYVVVKPLVPPTIPTTYIDEKGVSQTAEAWALKTSLRTVAILGKADTTCWYVVQGDVSFPIGAICRGDVRLILADGAKLTATGTFMEFNSEDIRYNTCGIEVSGAGNSLTAYCQATHSGQLIATGQTACAAIGGKYNASGSNIIIVGGHITANGGNDAAGIGCGYGYLGSNSNIKVGTTLVVIADGTVIKNNGGDLAGSLRYRRVVTITDLTNEKHDANAEIDTIVSGVTNADILALAQKAKTDVDAATTAEEINSIKTPALEELKFTIKIYNAGKVDGIEEGKAAILDALPTEAVPGVQLKVTKTVDGKLKQIILMNPDKVEYLKGNPPENHGLILESPTKGLK